MDDRDSSRNARSFGVPVWESAPVGGNQPPDDFYYQFARLLHAPRGSSNPFSYSNPGERMLSNPQMPPSALPSFSQDIIFIMG